MKAFQILQTTPWHLLVSGCACWWSWTPVTKQMGNAKPYTVQESSKKGSILCIQYLSSRSGAAAAAVALIRAYGLSGVVLEPPCRMMEHSGRCGP